MGSWWLRVGVIWCTRTRRRISCLRFFFVSSRIAVCIFVRRLISWVKFIVSCWSSCEVSLGRAGVVRSRWGAGGGFFLAFAFCGVGSGK